MSQFHDTTNYMVAGSCIWIKKDGQSNYIDLGNIASLSTTRNTETLDHYRSCTGKREKDRTEVVSEEISFSISLDELHNRDVLDLILGATGSADWTQNTSSSNSQNITVALDRYFQLEVSSTAARKVTINSVTNGTVTLTEDTDYLVDTDSGLILFKSTSSNVSASDTVTVDFDAAAIDGDQINPLTENGAVELDGVIIKLKDTQGKVQLYTFDNASIVNAGDMAINDQDWSTAQLEITVLSDGTTTAPFGTWYLIPA